MPRTPRSTARLWPPIFAFLGALLCALLLSACGSPKPPEPTSSRLSFGFADASYLDADAPKAATRAGDAGATMVRLIARWRSIQAGGPDAYNWSLLDGYVKALRAQGIRPLIGVTSAPGWALDPADECSSQLCPPARDKLAAWSTFITALVTRYKGDDLAGLEVWNEPNMRTDWKTVDGPDPGRFADLLTSAAAASRKVAPELPIVLGGLPAPADDTRAGKISAPKFLDAVYRAGARDSFDAIGVHPYPSPGRKAPGPDLPGFDAGLDAVRQSRDRNGDTTKPLWITEVGYFTGLNGGDGNATAKQQGVWLMKLFDHARDQRDIATFLVWRLRDDTSTPYEKGFGVLNPDWSPKPAYCAIADRFAPGEPPPDCAS